MAGKRGVLAPAVGWAAAWVVDGRAQLWDQAEDARNGRRLGMVCDVASKRGALINDQILRS